MNDEPVKKDSDIDENVSKNTEWQLSELIDAIAAEVDHAQDTLSLKSYGRGLSFAIKKLNLDIEVKVRRAEDGKFLFRTIDPDQASSTVLKLDFAQVLQNQLTDVRKSLDDISIADSGELESLPDITSEHTTALGKLGIHSIDDLKRYAQTSSMLAELSRKTQIEEVFIRQWLQLPLIREIKPNRGLASSIVVIEGDNFGNQSEQIRKVIFQQKTAKIVTWEDTRLTVVMPEDVIGSGMLLVQIGNQVTNTVLWETTGIPSISIAQNNSWIGFKLQPKVASDLTVKNNSILKGNQQLLKLLTLGISPQDNKDDSSIFSTKINGIGPFQVKAFEPNKIINLEASPSFRVRPRLDKINIYINQSKDTLIELLKKHKITAAVLPYSEELEIEFSNAQWKILSFRKLSQPLLHVQSLHLNERLLNPFDINWNAHLWYLQQIAGK